MSDERFQELMGLSLEEFDAVLREEAKKPMTKEEIRAQRISFAMGMLPHDSKISREYMEKMHDSIYG